MVLLVLIELVVTHCLANFEQPEIHQYHLKPKKYYLIACRLEPENNIHLLIKGFIKSNSTLKLVIAGGANYKSEYIDNLKKNVTDNVVFLGPIYEKNHI